MCKIWLSLILFLSSVNGICNHIVGGEMYSISHSTLLNISGDYTIGLDLYAECTNNSDSLAWVSLFPPTISIAIYSNATGKLFFTTTNHKLIGVKSISGGKLPACVVNAGLNCYIKANYSFSFKIPYDPNGFTIIYESCCRTSSATNLSANQGFTITYKVVQTETPYSGVAYFADNNNTVICANSPFSLPLLTQLLDLPNINFSYHLTPAYGSNVSVENQVILSKGEPFVPLLYDTIRNYSGYFPLGRNVSIDTLTSIISGIAPPAGDYLINALIKEDIDGSTITFTRQFTLRVRSCQLNAAHLDSVRLNCDSLNVSFTNQSTYKGIAAYQWQFLKNNTVIGNTADSTPNFTFPDSGTYTIKLTVTNTAGCRDSALQQLRLYPFLKTGFTIRGNCVQQPYVFIDTSTTTFGSIQSRHWDFGDETTATDTSALVSPIYKYNTQGSKTVQLTVSNTKGCISKVQKTLTVTDKAPLLLSTHDTLICSRDTLTLLANGQGIISWSPSYNILGAQSASPSVFPKQTTSYIATINASGCLNADTVVVNVLNFISVDAGNDISICMGDSIQIKTDSKALSYAWSPVIGLSSVIAKSPLAAPVSNTQYIVTANVGKCQAKDTVLVSVYPYPMVNAGNDVIICNGAKTILQGTVNSSNYYWVPSPSLFNTGSLNTMVVPAATTQYVLTGYNQQGCTKPVSDTIMVTVIPNITINAGRDTTVVIGQPLQLHASGGSNYTWSPATGLNDPNISDPVTILDGAMETVRYVVTGTAGSCSAQDDIVVKVFKSKPDIYVPSAFTPNHDGRNDYLRAIPVGIKTFLSFDIYGRWGGLLFHTTDASKAWDGRIQGGDQPNGTYVYIAKGIDYLGNLIEKSGTVTIIR